MWRRYRGSGGHIVALTMFILLVLAGTAAANAVVNGISPTANSFSLAAREAELSTADGNSMLAWCYADVVGGTLSQYPGPTLIVNEGQTITVTLSNELGVPVSIVFPGQTGVVATGGQPGLITREAVPGGTVNYTFTASNPGTYTYHSGTRPELQVEMGLFGALIVRPAGFDPNNPRAYGDVATAYDHEYLFVLSEADDRVHDMVAFNRIADIDNTDFHSVYWFINGRGGPDSLFPDGVPWLPHQPYGAMARMRPGDRVLVRMVGGGREFHPFHTHGNNFVLIAQDGRLLSSDGVTADLGVSDFTQRVVPGETYDAIFEWTGFGMNWDIFGHTAADAIVLTDVVDNRTGVAAVSGPCIPGDCFDDTTWEYVPDHEKALPVILPDNKDLTFGGFWSGSPYLGAMGALPPGEGGLNLNGGFFFMWHSHTEKELVNNDVFPGGMLTMMIVEPPGVAIP